jgi:hypothetical protein
MADSINNSSPFFDPQFMQMLGASMIGATNPSGQNFAVPAIDAWMKQKQLGQQQLQHEQNLGYNTQRLRSEDQARERRFDLQELEVTQQGGYRDRMASVAEQQESRLGNATKLEQDLTKLKIKAAEQGLDEMETVGEDLYQAAKVIGIDEAAAKNLAGSAEGQRTLLQMIRDKASSRPVAEKIISDYLVKAKAMMIPNEEILTGMDELRLILGMEEGSTSPTESSTPNPVKW